MLTIFNDVKEFWKDLFSSELNGVQDYAWFTILLLLVLGETILAAFIVAFMAIVYSVSIVAHFVIALFDYKSLRKAVHFTLGFAKGEAEKINEMWQNHDK